jgi:hypothetical protein
VLTAVWVALSRRNRLLRLAAFFLLPTAMYLAQAPQLVVWVSIIMTAIILLLFIHASVTKAPHGGIMLGLPEVRFHLRDIFFATLLVAVSVWGILAISRMNPLPTRQPIRLYLIIEAIAIAFMGLAATYVVLARRAVIVRASVLGIALGVIGVVGFVVPLDHFAFVVAFRIIGVWPDPTSARLLSVSMLCLIAGVVAMFLWLSRRATPADATREVEYEESEADSSNTRPAGSLWAQAALVMMAVAILIPLAYLYYELVRPIPIPETSLPDPNGYPPLLAIARQVEQGALAPAAAVARTRAALGLPSRVPVAYGEPYDLSSVQAFRALARCLIAQANAAMANGARDEALALRLDLIHLSDRIEGGGTMLEWLLVAAFERHGIDGLTQLCPELTLAESRDLLTRLVQHDRDREPVEEFLRRDDAHQRLSHGWWGRWSATVDRLANFGERQQHVFDSVNHRDAVRRVFICDLAIHVYRLEKGRVPGDLGTLVPNFLEAVPIDPFDGQPIRYRIGEGDYVVYSVGWNRRDDGGEVDRTKADCATIRRSISTKAKRSEAWNKQE